MSIPQRLTIVRGSLAPDGGSIILEALDEHSRLHRIFLDWSDYAQHFRNTSLRMDEGEIAKRSADEAQWIRIIASAAISAADSSPKRDLANAGLAMLRDRLVECVRSPIHDVKPA